MLRQIFILKKFTQQCSDVTNFVEIFQLNISLVLTHSQYKFYS